MNFLAHMYLSGESDKILVGNFIGDFVKGKHLDQFDAEIQKGIILHRIIDSFTDNHDIVKNCKNIFSEEYRKYAGVVVDIVFDHFLARNWKTYYALSLDEFISHSNKNLARYFDVFPQSVQKFFPKFIMNNWVKRYETLDGIENVLEGMSRHTSLPNHVKFAMNQILSNYNLLNEQFLNFFSDILAHVLRNHDISFSSKYIIAA